MQEFLIKQLSPGDAVQLSQLLTGDEAAYGQHFIPFSADRESLAAQLSAAVENRYWGFWLGELLIGFFMLRGFDEGYQRPSFGVYIAQSHSGRGLSKLALDFSMSWCRLNGVCAMMLKVHPDNTYARGVYEQAGFNLIEVCPRTGHQVMEKSWRGKG